MEKGLSFGLLVLMFVSFFVVGASAYSVNASTSVVFSSISSENSNNGGMVSDDFSSWKTDIAWIFAIVFIIAVIIWWIYSIKKNKSSKVSSLKVSGSKKKRKR
jgi:uncharacterized BrkB/YihY/UPF0761 family membrane protein